MTHPITPHKYDSDHETWMRCFTAAIAGRVARVEETIEQTVQECAAVADAALEQEVRRRPDIAGRSRG